MTELYTGGLFGPAFDQGVALMQNRQKQRVALIAGDAYSRGDVRGASVALSGNGYLDDAQRLDQNAANLAETNRKAQSETYKDFLASGQQIIRGMLQLPDDATRQHFFDNTLAPQLKAQGIPDDYIERMRAAPKDNRTLSALYDSFGGEVKKYQFIGGGDGPVYVGDQSTGNISMAVQPRIKYDRYEVKDAAGNTAVGYANPYDPYGDGDRPGYGSADVQPFQPALTAPSRNAGNSAFSQPPALGGDPASGTLAQRNNNPGNLRPDGSKWQGMVGSEGGFIQFDTPENGRRAASINLANQTKLHGIRTLNDLIAKYAPTSDKNDTAGYIQSVSQQTGIAPDQQVDFSDPAIQAKVLPAMFNVEGGGTPAKVPAPPQQTAQPDFHQNGGARLVASAPGFGQTASGLDADAQTIVQAIGEGRMGPLSMTTRNPRNLAIMAAVEDQYPGYDADVWRQRQETTKNYFGGTAGKQLASLNTTIEHLSSLADQVDAVNNSDAGSGLNQLGNAIAANIPFSHGSAVRKGQLNALHTNIQGVLHEAMNAYKATGGSEAEFNGLLKDFGLNDPRVSQYQVIQKIAQLLDGKRQQLIQQYQTGMGGNVAAPDQLVDRNADKVMSRINDGAEGLSTQKKPMQSPQSSMPAPTIQGMTAAQAQRQQSFVGKSGGAPVGTVHNPYVPVSEHQYNNLPNGAHYIGQDGSVRQKGVR